MMSVVMAASGILARNRVQDGQVTVAAVGAPHGLQDPVGARLQRHVQAGHDVRGLGHGLDDVVGEVPGVGRGEADALQALDLTAPAQQFAERVPISELRTVRVDVLTEQGDLEYPVGDERTDLGQDVAGAAVLLLAAQAGHDAEGAGVVAAHRDRDPGGVDRLAPGRQQRRERLQRLGELGLRLVPDPGPFEQRRQRGHVVRAVDHVDPGRAFGDTGALHLGQAAAHRDLHALLLLRQQVTEVAVEPVGRVLPDRAGVEHHHVGGLRRRRRPGSPPRRAGPPGARNRARSSGTRRCGSGTSGRLLSHDQDRGGYGHPGLARVIPAGRRHRLHVSGIW